MNGGSPPFELTHCEDTSVLSKMTEGQPLPNPHSLSAGRRLSMNDASIQ